MYFFSSSMSIPKKSKKEADDEDCSIDVSKEAKTYLEKFLGDVSKTSATKQIIIGSTTGWYYMFHIVIFIIICVFILFKCLSAHVWHHLLDTYLSHNYFLITINFNNNE